MSLLAFYILNCQIICLYASTIPSNVSFLVNSLSFESSWRAVLTSGNQFDAPRAMGTFDYSTVQGQCGWKPKTNRTSLDARSQNWAVEAGMEAPDSCTVQNHRKTEAGSSGK